MALQKKDLGPKHLASILNDLKIATERGAKGTVFTKDSAGFVSIERLTPELQTKGFTVVKDGTVFRVTK